MTWLDFFKHGSHDQSVHGKKGGGGSASYDSSKSVDADTKVSLIGGGTARASEMVESHGAPQSAFEIVGSWMPNGSIKIGEPFNSDGSQGPLKAPDWKSAQWKQDNWGKRANVREFLS